jgi:N-acetylglucosaminyldiphosphoundecaprenol N-acetyl-beta-D-mannosaminyltransferase
MSTLIHNPQRDCVNSFGIPVDNLSLDQTISQILKMAQTRDGRARLVSTLNVDFLVNAVGTRFKAARHPELLDVLRNSDLVTADGFPIVWLSRILGRPLQQRVCGSDLVPALGAKANEKGLSLFLLGGGDGVAERAAQDLCAQNPGLRIAGTAAPYVHTEGPGLANCIADDAAIVRQINQSGADILLVGLGNPKQELWFNRNREQLQTPVSIGVGGTFEFITGSVRRAPQWFQRHNLEWVYRITQDPGRLWRRYCHGLFKLASISLPLLQARVSEMLAFSLRRASSPESMQWRTVWANRDEAMNVIRLPRLVSRDYLQALVANIDAQRQSTALFLLDFSKVKRIEMAGHESLLSLAELGRSGKLNLRFLGIPDRVRRNLALTRVLDVVKTDHSDALDLLTTGSGNEGFSCRSYSLEDGAMIFLGGRVSGDRLQQMAFAECLRETSRDRNCFVDLRGVSLLEGSAIACLSPFFETDLGSNGRVYFTGLTPALRQMLRVAGLGMPRWSKTDAELLAVICDGAS